MTEGNNSSNQEIVLACIEERFFQKEVLIEQHAIVKILSGEMRVVQADKTHTFGAGDIVLFPRNTLTTVTKYPKDDCPYRSVLLYMSSEKLQGFYARNKRNSEAVYDMRLRTFKSNILFESFFASLIPYLEMKGSVPENIAGIKIEETISILRTISPDIDSLLANFEHPGKLNLADFMEKKLHV